MYRKVALFLLIASFAGSFAMAQDTPATTEEPPMMEEESPDMVMATVVAEGLNNPRHITYGPDGTLYIVEAGSAGDMEAQGPFGPVAAGLTGQVSAVAADGTSSVVVPELVSINLNGAVEGATAVLVTEDAYWVALGRGTQEPIAENALVEAVIAVDRESGDVTQVIDMREFELANNPDASQELVSNPSDLALAEDGTLYIVDASGNALYSWTADGGLTLLVAWPTGDDEAQAVPSSVEIGADGSIYVGFLSGFPFQSGSARIERYSPDGTLQETFEGLTLVTDLLVGDDGTLYAVEMASGFGDTGFIPDSGRIVTVSSEGIEPVFEGLNFPYGLAVSSDGQMVVTVDSAFVGPDSGRVIVVNEGMEDM